MLNALSSEDFLVKQISAAKAIICVIASQIANVGESIIGAALQEKEGFRWVGNHSNDYLLALFTLPILMWYGLICCILDLVCLHSHELWIWSVSLTFSLLCFAARQQCCQYYQYIYGKHYSYPDPASCVQKLTYPNAPPSLLGASHPFCSI
jgi:hypothetical protein